MSDILLTSYTLYNLMQEFTKYLSFNLELKKILPLIFLCALVVDRIHKKKYIYILRGAAKKTVCIGPGTRGGGRAPGGGGWWNLIFL